MIENEGMIERAIRIIVGLGLVWLALYKITVPSWLWGTTIVGILLIITGLAGYCPLWHLLKIKTK